MKKLFKPIALLFVVVASSGGAYAQQDIPNHPAKLDAKLRDAKVMKPVEKVNGEDPRAIRNRGIVLAKPPVHSDERKLRQQKELKPAVK